MKYLLFPSSDICSTMALPTLQNSDHAVVSVSTDFQSNTKGDASFPRMNIFINILVLIKTVTVII